MGTADVAERELLQGVIKLAAAFVHDARSNATGIRKNLAGARTRIEAGVAAATAVGIDADGLLRAIDARLGGQIEVGEPPIEIVRGEPRKG
jgi:predicted metal-dependent hydrolase